MPSSKGCSTIRPLYLILGILALLALPLGAQAQSPPDPPTGLRTSAVTQNSMSLHWTGSAGATGHEVQLLLAATRAAVLSDWITATSPGQYDYAALTPNTAYILQVRARNNNGASTIAEYTETTLPAVPQPTYSAISANSLTLEWPAVTGGATGYEYVQNFPSIGNVVTLGASTTSVTFNNLRHSTAYGYQVRSVSGSRKSRYAPTALTYTSPLPPSNPRTTCVAGTVVHLTWNASPPAPSLSQPPIVYEIKINNGGTWKARGASVERVITQLSVGTTYRFFVRALIKGLDTTAYSSEIHLDVTTAAAQLEPPTSLQTSEISNNSAKLTWTASTTSSVTYEVSKDGSTWVAASGNLEHTFTGLDPETSYQFHARAKSGSSVSCANSAAAIETLPDPPAAPTGLETGTITQTSIVLNWTKSAAATAYKARKDSDDDWTELGDVATYTFSGLTANTEYDLEVVASNAGGDSAAATLTASTLPNAPPAPTGLTTGTITQTSIVLDWTKSAGATIYKVRKDSDDDWTELGDVATYTFTGLTANTEYDLEVVASNSGGDSAAAALTASTLPNAPPAPTGLTTGEITQTSIVLNWTKSAGATGYKVQEGSGDVTALGDVATYTFTGLTADTSYVLKVIAFNSGGDSAAASGSASTLPNAPAAPTGLTTSGITQTEIVLNWTKSAGATGYKVQEGSGDVTALGDVATYTFTGLTADTSYVLKVIAFNSGGDSTAASGSASTLPNAPAAPTGLASSGITQTEITLSWTKSTGATAYKVRKDSDDEWTTLGDVATHTFSSLTAGTEYDLEVVASNSGGESAAAALTVSTLPDPPEPPTGLTHGAITQTSIVLNWTQSAGATAYAVRKDSDSWTVLEDVATYTFTGLTAGTEYVFSVVANNAAGNSAAATYTISTKPEAPTGLATGAITQTSIVLNWTKSAGATGYKVQAGSGDVTTLGDVATYTFEQLTAGTSYDLKVIAFNAGGDSAAKSISASTLPSAPGVPSGLTTSGITQTTITLGWTKVADSAGYQVNGGALSDWHDAGDVASYEFTGLSAGTSYTLQVRSKNQGGNSDPAQTTVSTVPAAPTGVAVDASSITQTAITITWTKSTGATTYEVNGGVLSGWTDAGDVATYTFTGLSAGTGYSLEVRAKNASGETAAPAVSGTTVPAAPTGVAASGITQSAITLGWTKSTGATGYEVSGGTLTGWHVVGDVAAYTFTGLSADTEYSLEVRAKNASGTTAAPAVSATTLAVPPAAPTGLTTSGITQSAITLGWTKSARATGYKVQANSGTVVTLGDVAAYSFSGLTANTAYTLKVTAFNSGGDSSAASSSATTLASPPPAPAAPTGLTTSGITHNSITLGWTKSTGATAYKVRKDSGDSWTTLGDVAAYVFTGLSANTQYTLEVLASNSGGDSSAASTSATTLASPPPAPAAPTGLTTSGITHNSITLGWTKSTGATTYEVNGGALSGWTDAGDVATYTFTGLSAGTSYSLQVRAKNTGGETAAPAVSAVTVPAAPTGVAVDASATTQTAITLEWTKSTGATSYEVQGGTHNSWHDVGDVALYEFTGLSVGTSYSLEVRAKNASGESPAESVSGTTVPAAPTGLTVSGQTQTTITVTWAKSTGATGYKVQVDSGAATALGDVNTHTFSSLSANTEYVLKIYATNASGDSPAVSGRALTLPNAPAAPTGLSTSGITQTAITLNWTKSAGATGYKVRKASADSWTVLGDVATYTFTSLQANTQYNLAIQASNSGGDSSAVAVSARTLAAQAPTVASPSNVSATSNSQTAITLSWTKANGAASYEVNGGVLSGWTDVGDVATYTFSGLSADTAYTLSVRSKSGQNTSTAISVSSRTPPDPPAPPSGLSADNISQTGVDVDWDRAPDADGYEARGDTMAGSQAVSQAVSASSQAVSMFTVWTDIGSVNAYSFAGLQPDTLYRIYVRAENDGGVSQPAYVDFRTLPRQESVDNRVGSRDSNPSFGDSNPPVADGSDTASGGAPAAPAAPAATAVPPQFLCTDAQKALLAISPQPFGLNVQCLDAAGVGDARLTRRGIVLGVDVWGWVRGDFEVCFTQAGDMAFLDAAYAPRLLTEVQPYSRDGMICYQVERAGTLVLLEASSANPTAVPPLAPTTVSAASPTAIPQATATALPAPADACIGRTTDPLNFRDAPVGQYLLTLPAGAALTILDRQNDWLQVVYNGQTGWVSAVYVRAVSGDCP